MSERVVALSTVGSPQDAERMLVIKTRTDKLPALREALVSLHPYQVPELLALEIADGHPPYLGWIDESVAVRPGPEEA